MQNLFLLNLNNAIIIQKIKTEYCIVVFGLVYPILDTKAIAQLTTYKYIIRIEFLISELYKFTLHLLLYTTYIIY